MQPNRPLHHIVVKFEKLTDDPTGRFDELAIVPYALWTSCVGGYWDCALRFSPCNAIGEDESTLLFADLADVFCQCDGENEGKMKEMRNE